MIVRYAIGRCALGRLLVATSPRGICAIALGDDEGELELELRYELPHATRFRDDGGFPGVMRAVAGLAEGRESPVDLVLDLDGTAFQVGVWNLLREIPPGETRTYAEIARALGAPGAARAVGSACARNRIALAVPCHRALCADGALGGYRWGVTRKRSLIERELLARAGAAGSAVHWRHVEPRAHAQEEPVELSQDRARHLA